MDLRYIKLIQILCLPQLWMNNNASSTFSQMPSVSGQLWLVELHQLLNSLNIVPAFSSCEYIMQRKSTEEEIFFQRCCSLAVCIYASPLMQVYVSWRMSKVRLDTPSLPMPSMSLYLLYSKGKHMVVQNWSRIRQESIWLK